MKLILSLLFLVGCSTPIDQQSYDFKYHNELKRNYTEFLKTKVFTNGHKVFAGPAFIQFVNGQPIKLSSISPVNSQKVIFNAPDESKHEYEKLDLHKNSRGQTILWLQASFESSDGKLKKLEFPLILENKVFSFNSDYFSAAPFDLTTFNDSEATAIKGRYLIPGMSKRAAELAIGKTTQYLHGFENIKFENNVVKTFTFRFRNDLPLFANP